MNNKEKVTFSSPKPVKSTEDYTKSHFELRLTKLHHSIAVNFASNPLIDKYPESLKSALINLAQEIKDLEIEPDPTLYADDYPF